MAVVGLSPARFAFPAQSVGIALETGIALAALLSAYLLLGRFGPGLRLDHAFLGAALATVAATGMLLGAAHGVQRGTVAWVALYTGGLAGTALPGLAALGFARRARPDDDELVLWMVPGAVCIAFAHVGYLLFPPAPASWVHIGDIFRALFCLVVLVGVVRWIRGYWRDLAATAVAEERRRIARELHDGLAQELALIRRRTPWLARQREAAEAREIIAATERALDESRRAIHGLRRSRDEPLERVLAREAQQLTAGTRAQVSLDLARGVELQPDVQENLVRIAREAVANAARHGGAATIRVELVQASPLRMRVVDDGVGFDAARGSVGGGYGLPSMRERAAAIGADLTLRSLPGRGTEVLVRLP
jgi:signal transduction histidine kinase